MVKNNEEKLVKITLIRSVSGRIPRHRATARCLGLWKMHQSVTVKDIPSIRGMINQVSYMLKIEEQR